MSSSSANAAALAAFQGLASRSKSELIHDKKNPQKFKIPLNIDTNLPKIDRKLSISSKRSQGPSTMKRSSSQNLQTPGVKPQLQLPIQLPKIRTTAEGGGLVLPTRLALMSLTSQFKLPTRPLSSPLQRQAPSLPTVPLSVSTSSAASASVAATAALIAALSLNLNLNLNLDVPTTPVQRSQSYRKILPSGSASILESLDYFNAQTQNSQKSTPSSQDMINNVKKSIGSKMKIASMESTNSREMINQVKQSINSKATKAPSKDESFQKQQVRIQEIRDSIDQKRIQTQSPLYSTSSVSGQFPQPNLSTEFFERNSNSYSSIGSSLHSNGSDLVLLRPLTPIAMDPTPKIVVGEHGNKLRNSIVQVEGSPTRNGEELVPSIGNDGLAESIFLEKRAPRRKPPPQSSPKEQQEELNNDNYDSYSFFSELPSFNPPKTPVIDSYSSKSLFEIPPIDTPPERAESTSSFPQFPNIFNKKSKENGDVKKNRHSFWGHRKVSQEYDTTNEDTESEYYDKDDDDLPISLADTPSSKDNSTSSNSSIKNNYAYDE